MKASTVGRATALVALLSPMVAAAFAVMGKIPTGLRAMSDTFPNSDAVQVAMVVPEIERGFTSQGIVIDGDTLFIGGYLSGDHPRCRLFAIDIPTNKVVAALDLPLTCKHAGGLAKVGSDRLLVADTPAIYQLTFFDTPARRMLMRPKVSMTKLVGKIKGSFILTRGNSFYLGVYSKKCEETFIYGFPLDKLLGPKIDEVDITAAIQIPTYSQGATFLDDKTLLLASNTKHYGRLTEMTISGSVERSTAKFVRGVEGVALDETGSLWTVSESGSKQYQDWVHAMPAALRIDRSKLAKSSDDHPQCVH